MAYRDVSEYLRRIIDEQHAISDLLRTRETSTRAQTSCHLQLQLDSTLETAKHAAQPPGIYSRQGMLADPLTDVRDLYALNKTIHDAASLGSPGN